MPESTPDEIASAAEREFIERIRKDRARGRSLTRVLLAGAALLVVVCVTAYGVVKQRPHATAPTPDAAGTTSPLSLPAAAPPVPAAVPAIPPPPVPSPAPTRVAGTTRVVPPVKRASSTMAPPRRADVAAPQPLASRAPRVLKRPELSSATEAP